MESNIYSFQVRNDSEVIVWRFTDVSRKNYSQPTFFGYQHKCLSLSKHLSLCKCVWLMIGRRHGEAFNLRELHCKGHSAYLLSLSSAGLDGSQINWQKSRRSEECLLMGLEGDIGNLGRWGKGALFCSKFHFQPIDWLKMREQHSAPLPQKSLGTHERHSCNQQ